MGLPLAYRANTIAFEIGDLKVRAMCRKGQNTN
jgi:hypothetical protein